ncbi:CRISPR-associated helicase/endonuclease Cas3 [Psychromonas sp. MB-3u-54]|uniref:CRISPR-associated helicase/endonuclease Cas3 n=1 Tax=Psychromonas sp. MB-3u-54 TaxID=2058319 RepID=UPI000C3435CA|nr:CRISPR-associated helicase/endonuclease Cas3 [Psychromonas sp. MB-3u-54]PKH02940.1 CRISPR-associated helicase/endonuclease Cas3 [Psychromonas sp. MB-3u-54]
MKDLSPSDLKSYFKYWGKAKKDENTEDSADYHLLVFHCLDVTAVADIWLEESNTLLSQMSWYLKSTREQAKRISLFFILLHDLGKFDARFQNFREDIRQILQGDDWEVDPDPTYYSHGSCGYRQFSEMFDTNEAMKAVAGHHGYCDTSQPYHDPDADDELLELDEQARKEWVEFSLDFCQLKEVPDVGDIPMLAGLCSVADWVGSSITNFTTDPSINLQQYYQETLLRARKALVDTGMIEKSQGAGFAYLFNEYRPRGIQTLLSEMPLKAGLTLVESDTGSGKTEFALAYASSLIEAGLADGVVFGLPTQATANGLFSRVGDAAKKLFPDTKTTLAHGKSKYLMSDESGFLQQSNKRAFLGSMSVATIDQILMGVLGIRHQFVRSFGTRKSVLVLDEIHSFDAYMLGLIEQVLKGQHQAYSSVILLSATLPNTLKEKLLSTYKGKSLNNAYPLVSHTDLFANTQEFTLPKQATNKTITLKTWCSDNLLPSVNQRKKMIDWVSHGAMVGVICNTVKDAQRLYHQLKIANPELKIELFHARFTFNDRKKREDQVLENYDKNAKRTGRLLIATQVIEQSLDLDFDVLISQIAPIEFLMQRMGRLWRHERIGSGLCPRASCIKAPLFITLLPNEKITDLTSSEQLKHHYQGSGYVYQNSRLLYRTEQYLNQHPLLHFPDCYREAINYVHEEQAYPEEPEVLTLVAEEYDIKADGSNYTARSLSKLQSKPLNDVDPRCALLTRDGEMSATVVLFNEDGSLLHGGDFNEQQDRENSTVALAKKHAKGIKDERYYCYKAVVGKDIIYNEMGFLTADLNDELTAGS